MKRILIVEDDKSILELQKDYLEISGYNVKWATEGISGEKLALSEDFDLIILDLMLPGKDGFSILKTVLEQKEIPILIVSAKDEEMYKIKGLNSGAVDYITKPFSMGELVARVNSHIKMFEKLRTVSDRGLETNIINVRDMRIDVLDRRIFIKEQEVVLKQKEFDLLMFLVENPNRVYNKEQLFERVWGYDALSDASTVTVHIARIREKIEQDPQNPQFIETVWGAGYRFKL